MTIFVLVFIGYAVVIIFEFIPLFRRKIWPDIWMNAVIGLFSFTVALLLSLNVKIPSPEKPIRELIISIVGK